MPNLEIFPWNENFESGIPLIDEQHRRLVDLLNHLVRKIATQSGTVELTKTFAEIKDYVTFHFASEEDIWKNHFEGDVWEKWHHQSHQDFAAEVAKMEARSSEQPFDEALLNVVRFLTHWLARHILDSDRRMAKVVLALPSGISLARAKEAANEEMAGSTKLLIDTLMTMYDKLADSTVQMSREIQRRKSAEQELLLSKQIVEAASRAKSAFLANMSHELRTPLNTILGYSDILLRDPALSESHRETLAIVHRSGAHLLDVINDVLELTKIETGHVQLDMQPFSLADMVVEVVEMLTLRAREKGVRLSIDTAPNAPHYVVSDEAKIRQILINLMSNAIKATREGSVNLRLTWDDAAQRLTLLVADTGIGIAAPDLERIFEPFEQIHPQLGWQGTGLGLAICKQFVEALNGEISVTSSLGRGSSFSVSLPVALANAEQIPIKAGGQGEVLALAQGQGVTTVLVVEDDPDNQALLAKLLERVGFQVLRADSGEAAVALVRQHLPQFIWMDRRLSGLSGAQATLEIRQLPHGRNIKIAAVTASSLREDDQELHASGFDAIVYKPFKARQIYECMESLLGLRFVRAQVATPGTTDPLIDPAAMAAVPVALRTELREALLMLNQDRIVAVIQLIGQNQPDLGAALHAAATRYHYASIHNQLPLDSTHGGPPA